MDVDPGRYFDLSMDELREVSRFALTPAEHAMRLLERAPDPRTVAALEAARLFVSGQPRSILQRTAALDAHRAAKEAPDAVGQHVAAAAGDAAASAYLHPLAKGEQVGHILRSTAHAALAAEAVGGDGAATAVLEDAINRATPVVLNVLHRYPPFPAGRALWMRIVSELDRALRHR